MQFREELWSGNKAANLWKHLNSNSIEIASGARVINYAVKGVGVCKSFYKRATGINPGLFDKVVRAVLAGTSHRRTSRNGLVVALSEGLPIARVSVKAVQEHLLTMRQRHALLVMDMIFKGRILVLVYDCCIVYNISCLMQTKAYNSTRLRTTKSIPSTHGNLSTSRSIFHGRHKWGLSPLPRICSSPYGGITGVSIKRAKESRRLAGIISRAQPATHCWKE